MNETETNVLYKIKICLKSVDSYRLYMLNYRSRR
jgi:hypothetical protein